MTSFGLTCFAVHAISARRTVAGAARRSVVTGARSEAEHDAISALLRVAEPSDLIVDVALAEIAFTVPQERPTCKGTYLSRSHNVNKAISWQIAKNLYLRV